MSDNISVRLLTVEEYEETIEESTRAFDDAEPYFVTGTQAPERDFADMLVEYVDLAFGSHVPHDLLERARNGLEDTRDETPHHYFERPTTHDPNEIVERYGDVVYPTDAFDDVDSETITDALDTTLTGTLFAPGDVVDPAHPDVYSRSEYLDAFRSVIGDRDPDELAVYMGAFYPGRNYSIKVDGGVFRIADSIYSTGAFVDQTSLRSVNKARKVFYGTAIVPRTVMSSDGLAVVDGEKDEVVSERPDVDQADAENAGEA